MTTCLALEAASNLDWPCTGDRPPERDPRRSATGQGAAGYDIRPQSETVVVVRGWIDTTAIWGWDRRQGRKHNGVIHAQRETAATSSMFARSMRASRCLVPVTAFYGLERDPVGRPGRRFAFRPRWDDLLLLAALWETRPSPLGPERRFVILTRPSTVWPNILLRAPVALDRGGAESWLSEGTPEALQAAVDRSSDAELQGLPVPPEPDHDHPPGRQNLLPLGRLAWQPPRPPPRT